MWRSESFDAGTTGCLPVLASTGAGADQSPAYPCQRPSLAAWWRSFVAWSHDRGSTSYLSLPTVEPLAELSQIAKSLRNLRDRLARDESWLIEDLAFFGISDGDAAHIVVSHPRLKRVQVQKRLRVLWAQIVLEDVPAAPSLALSPRMLALLGRRGRGLQPCRFAVLPRGTA